MSEVLSPTVFELLTEHVDSFEKLEVLVFLAGCPHMTATVADFGPSFGVPVGRIEEALHGLVDTGAVARLGSHFWVREDERSAALELRLVYPQERSAVFNHLTRRALDRIRRSIPDAFGGGSRGRDDRDGGTR